MSALMSSKLRVSPSLSPMPRQSKRSTAKPSSAKRRANSTNWRWLPARYCGPPTMMTTPKVFGVLRCGQHADKSVFAASEDHGALGEAHAVTSSRSAASVAASSAGAVSISLVCQKAGPCTDRASTAAAAVRQRSTPAPQPAAARVRRGTTLPARPDAQAVTAPQAWPAPDHRPAQVRASSRRSRRLPIRQPALQIVHRRPCRRRRASRSPASAAETAAAPPCPGWRVARRGS